MYIQPSVLVMSSGRFNLESLHDILVSQLGMTVRTAAAGLLLFVYEKLHIPYTYKFLRDVNFADDSNLGFSRFYFR